MTVIKRDRKESASELVKAIEKFVGLLRDQEEDDAADELVKAAEALRKNEAGGEGYRTALASVVEAFEGEHDLMVYTHQRKPDGEWTPADELALASSRVLSLAKRLR
jgi:hypothetical protein